MLLSAGTRLGPYEIVSALGAGGMGQVYRARDTRLARTVALKVLAPEFVADPARRQRFEQEARVVATLDHPHICALHDIGTEPSASGLPLDYLVLEHLEGQTLADRLAQRGRLPLGEALRVAAEIASALLAAHRRGIVHRDLKPANVMLTPTGAKLLDFGVARLTHAVEGFGATDAVSAIGLIVGTVPYMAPEQVQGLPVDARTDVFAFGAMLYEMLAGRRAFEGGSPATVIAAILEHEPAPITSFQAHYPPALDRLVRKCLAKDPDARWQTADDLRDELLWIAEAGPTGDARRPDGRRLALTPGLLLAGAIASAAAGAGLAFWLRPASASAPVARLSLDVAPADEMNAGGVGRGYVPPPGSRTALAWTPDGRSLVFIGRRAGLQHVYVRPLDADQARTLPGTEGAQVPAVSPDGQWVAFWASGALRKVRVRGGPAMVLLAEAEPPKGLAWSDDDRVYFGRVGAGIWSVPGAGGGPTMITTLGEAERSHVLSSALPGGRGILVTVRKREWTWGDEEVIVIDPTTGKRTPIVGDAADPRYVASGHLVFLRRGVLFAARFDIGRLVVTGAAAPVSEGFAQALVGLHVDNLTGAGQYAVSPTGSLAWVQRQGVPAYHESVPVAVDRRGRVTELGAPTRSYAAGLRVSSDGRQLAVSTLETTEAGVWTYDLSRSVFAPVERGGEAALSTPIFWSRDGRRVLFGWLHDGRFAFASQLAATDGSRPPATYPLGSFKPTGWAGSNRLIGVVDDDLAVASFDGTLGAVEPLLQTPDSREQWPEVSPDGQWLLYGSNVSAPAGEPSRFDIYVQPYPRGSRTLIAERASSPAWSPTGRELFYLVQVSDTKLGMISVDFAPGSQSPDGSARDHSGAADTPRLGKARLLFESEGLQFRCSLARCYDVAPDGERFYVMQVKKRPPQPSPITKLNVVLNWFQELEAKMAR